MRGMAADPLEQFVALCAANDWARLQLTQPPQGSMAERVHLRPVQIKAGVHWQAVWKHPTKDLCENWPAEQGPERLAALLTQGWRSAFLWAPQGHWQLDRQRKGGWKLVRHRGATADTAVAVAHNRKKPRALDLAHPAWAALGVAEFDAGSNAPRPVPAMARKWKQINHFLALVGQALQDAHLLDDPEAPLRVADFGCGRGYLTFAMALWLADRMQNAQVMGVELREDLVAQTETLARELRLDGLRFVQGDIGQREVQPLDVMVALHACDTATDHAIHYGLRAGARVILCAPCCHKELRGQMQPPSVLRPLFRHGVHLGQEAEMLTDALRALLLEGQGYDARVIEFVSLEHTQKNKMIVAVRRASVQSQQRTEALVQAQTLKAFWQIREQCLERLLNTS